MFPSPQTLAQKPFADTLLEELSIDPQQGVLGNLTQNLTRAADKKLARQHSAGIDQRMLQAIGQLPEPPAHPDLQGQFFPAESAPQVKWASVPDAVVSLLGRLREPAQAVLDSYPWPAASWLWLDLEKEALWLAEPAGAELAAWKLVPSPGPAWQELTVSHQAPTGEHWVLIKSANPLVPLRQGFDSAQKLLGGPTPLTSALAGGLLGSGLGYLGGSLAEGVLPEGIVQEGALRKRLGLLGGVLGAAPGLWWGSGNVRSAHPDVQGWQGWLSRYPYRAQDLAPSPAQADSAAPKTAAAEEPNESGALFVQSIPVDAFNRVVWNDVRQPPNPFGSRNPWGDNSQPLGTPPPVAAAVTGITSGARALTGQAHVSPWQIGLAAATAAGKGLVAGLVFGKALGTLAGLSPQTQKQLQTLGLWGGAVTGAMNELLAR